ncbi:PaaX family transcriptional regulator, partial [Serratia marcescens]|uniref:PaaX family transcriptional regulator n=2 Tax=Serratia TaxID=613 RepID=UPI000BD84210
MEHKLDEFIRHAIDAQPISGTSLIISLYGDALSHRGGEVWLGSLSALLEAFGFGDRFVRTSVFRLQKEGWLAVEKIGRRSFYRVTEQGMRQFRHAESKIYLREQPAWDGKWELLLLECAEKNARARLKKELGWLGFGQIANNLMAAP